MKNLPKQYIGSYLGIIGADRTRCEELSIKKRVNFEKSRYEAEDND